MLAGQARAQIFTTLYSATPSEGALPFAGLVLSGNTLYGTASEGGSSDKGTVFAVNADGTGFMVLHSFTDGNDGDLLHAGLVLSGNTLYHVLHARLLQTFCEFIVFLSTLTERKIVLCYRMFSESPAQKPVLLQPFVRTWKSWRISVSISSGEATVRATSARMSCRYRFRNRCTATR
jgi:uncharacterized repeat protein (TIGR03803 family)